jgi:hypothetical protein
MTASILPDTESSPSDVTFKEIPAAHVVPSTTLSSSVTFKTTSVLNMDSKRKKMILATGTRGYCAVYDGDKWSKSDVAGDCLCVCVSVSMCVRGVLRLIGGR